MDHTPAPGLSITPSGASLAYAVFAALWILLSDKLLAWLLGDSPYLALASVLKGWLFVAITAVLLYGLLSRQQQSRRSTSRQRRGRFVGVLATVAIVATTAIALVHDGKRERSRAFDTLAQRAELRARQLTLELETHRRNALFIRDSPVVQALYLQSHDRADSAASTALRTELARLQRHLRLRGIAVLGADGALRWLGPGTTPPAQHQRSAQAASLHDEPTLLGPYQDASGALLLAHVVPLPTGHGPAEQLLLVSALGHDSADSNPPAHEASWLVAPGPHGRGLLALPGTDRAVLSSTQAEQVLALLAPAQQTLPARVDRASLPIYGVAQPLPNHPMLLLFAAERTALETHITQRATWFVLAGLLALLALGAVRHALRARDRSTAINISAHTEAARAQALGVLGAIADGAADAIFAKDLQGRYLLVNRAASQVLGQPAEQLLGRDDTALLPTEMVETLQRLTTAALTQEQLQSASVQITRADAARSYYVTIGPLRDADARLLGVFGVARDDTPRQRSEAMLRDRERKLSAIIGHSPSALSLKYPDGSYALANPNLQRILCRPESQIIGRRDHELLPAAYAQVLAEHDAQVLAQRTRISVEETLPVEGQPRVFMAHVFPVLAGDGSVEYICRIALDIHQRKQAEEVLKARNAELERYNRAMVGCEHEMITLRQKINELSRALGRPQPYPDSIDGPPWSEPPKPDNAD